MDRQQAHEIMAFTRVYVEDDEIEHLGWARAADLATKRDAQAAESLRLGCEG